MHCMYMYMCKLYDIMYILTLTIAEIYEYCSCWVMTIPFFKNSLLLTLIIFSYNVYDFCFFFVVLLNKAWNDAC